MNLETIITADGKELVPIHFVSGSPLKIACMPGLTTFSATSGVNQSRLCPYQRTDDTRAVTCPSCIRSLEFTRAESEMNAALLRQQSPRRTSP